VYSLSAEATLIPSNGLDGGKTMVPDIEIRVQNTFVSLRIPTDAF
jgi:hypothetical protein